MTKKRLLIRHETHYRFDRPVTYALQRLKLRPKDNAGQTVIDWDIDIDGGRIQSACEDSHLNHVALVSVDSGRTEVSIKCSGTVETANGDGIIGKHRGHIPLWCFLKPTRLTTAGKSVAKMLGQFRIDATNELSGLHALSDIIRNYLPYEDGHTSATSTAEQAIAIGKGVCQDHAHNDCNLVINFQSKAESLEGQFMNCPYCKEKNRSKLQPLPTLPGKA